MTAPELAWETDRCPNCLQQNSVQLVGAERLCLACRHEWNPAETTGPNEHRELGALTFDAPAPVEIPPMPPEMELAAQVANARATFTGRTIVYHDEGVEGVVLEVFDSGYARCDFDGLELDLLPHEFSLVTDEATIADAVVAELGRIDLTVAARVLEAAAQTIVNTGDARELGLPPDGWLVRDPDAWVVVEHGAAYAVAFLAVQYGIATADLTNIASMLDDAANAAKEATGQ